MEEKKIEQLFGEKLDSTVFTWDNYCGTMGYSLVDMYDTRVDKRQEKLVFNEKYTCLGWCHATSLSVRPRTNGYAVMLWHKQDKVETWCHVTEVITECLLDNF